MLFHDVPVERGFEHDGMGNARNSVLRAMRYQKYELYFKKLIYLVYHDF